MEKQGNSDVAAFPALFGEMEQFIAEQLAEIRRTSAILAILAAAAGGALFFVLHKLA